MKKLLIALLFLTPYLASAAPAQTFLPSALPLITNRYYLGTSSPISLQWLGVFTKAITIGDLSGSGTRCVQTDNTGLLSLAAAACGSGSGGSGGGLASTTPWTVGDIVTVVDDATVTSVAPSTIYKWPFLKLSSGEQATSTTLSFQNGFLSFASSTVSALTGTTTNLNVNPLFKLTIGNSVVSTTTTVCAAGCQYTTIQSAIDSGARNIFVKDGTYSEQITIANTKTKLQAQSLLTIISCNGVTQSPCISGNAKDELTIDGFTITEATTQQNGIGLDISDGSLNRITNNRFNAFATSTKYSDTANNSFYTVIEKNTFFNPKSCIEISGVQANANWIRDNRCRPFALEGGFGAYIVNARGITISGDWEGTTTAFANTGIFINSSSREIVIENPWVEALGTGLNIEAGAARVTVVGGSLTSNGTDYIDNSTTTTFINVSKTGVQRTFSSNATTTNATSTTFAVSSLSSCDTIDTSPDGSFKCGTDNAGAGGGISWPFTKQAGNEQATSTIVEWIGGYLSNASSTHTGSTTLATTLMTNASSTELAITNNFTVSNLTSALVLTNTVGQFAEYTGIDCTNQFVRDVSALGAGTCATVVGADTNLEDLTATDTTLTFSGAYDGQTARTVGLNLGNPNTWTGTQTFADIAYTNATGTELGINNGGKINWNAGDLTLTHSADTLTLTGGTLATNDISIANGSGIRTRTNAGNTMLFQARDTGAGAYVTYDTFTAGNPSTRIATTTSATSTNFHISSNFNFGGVSGNSWDDYCVTITGSAGLCDGSDDGGAGGGNSKWATTTDTTQGIFANPATSVVGIGTTTPDQDLSVLQLASSTRSQLALIYGAGVPAWAMRNTGGNLDFSTTSPTTYATTTPSAFTFLGSGNPSVSIASSSPIAYLALNPIGTTYRNSFVIGTTASTSLTVALSGHTTFTQPITAPNVATTTIVNSQYCTVQSTVTHGSMAGNAFFNAPSMTNNFTSISPLNFLTGTTSQATCIFQIPETTASTTITTYYTSTSTTAGHNYALDVSVYKFLPTGSTYDPTDGVKTWLLSGSTTPAQRVAVQGTAWGGNATTTRTTTALNKGDLLYVIYDAYLADADDTASSDLIFPINPTIEIQR